MTATQALTQHGILRAAEVVQVAAVTGLELAAAATLLEKESHGGANIWGNDPVETGGHYVKGGPVTKANYLAYKAHRAQLGSQGVGPTQLTWSGYQDRADALGGTWDWGVNCRVGFDALSGLFKAHGFREGFRIWNGSGTAAESYATDAMARLQVWRDRIQGVPQTTRPTLHEGDMGAAVSALQKWLNATFSLYSHIDLAPRRYGPQTAMVIAEFQKRAGVAGAGVDPAGRSVGPRTWAALEHFGYR